MKEGGGKAGAASAEGGADARRQPQSNSAAKGASANAADHMGNATSATDEGHAAGSPATGAPGPTNDDAMSLIGRLFSNPTATVTESDRSAVVSLLTARAAMTNDEATQMVHQWEQTAQNARDQYQAFKAEAEQKARTAAAASAKALADAAWIAFVASVLAASAAALGAHLGGPRLTTDERRVAAARVVVNPV